MAFQYLKTKLDIPVTRKKKLPRPKFTRLLGDSAFNKTILVSAPAGYGKTSMIIEWTKTRRERFAWITLDETDNDPTRFYGYLKEALKPIYPVLGDTEDYLSSYPMVPISTSLTILLNVMAEYKQSLFIVLEDYHVITNPEVHEITTFLIQHSAVGINTIISTRLDPPFPLDRWRVSGNLLEIRQSDLSFSKEDVAILMNQIIGLNLTESEIANLNKKTEGWIAGLHIAALFLINQKDKSTAISQFSGNHSHIMNYLVAEVILRQPENMQSFLLESSVLDELSEQLCNFVTGRKDSRQLLNQLYLENQFIVQMDDQLQRYRFHQLFSDVLKNLLKQKNPGRIPDLHAQASHWYEKNNQLEEAIKQAFKGENHQRAVELIEKYAPTALEEGERATIREWIERLPENVIRKRTILNLMHAWSVMNDKTAAADALFEKRIKTAEAIEASSEKENYSGSLPKTILTAKLSDSITLIKAIYAFERGNPSKAFLPGLKQLLDQSDDRLRSGMFFLMAHIQIRTMELDAALISLDDAISLAKSKNYIYLATYSTYMKAWILFQKGKLHQTIQVCEQELKTLFLSNKYSKYALPITSALKIMISAVYYEWNRLEEADELLNDGVESLKDSTEIGIITNGIIKQAMVKIQLGKELNSVKSYITSLSMMDRFHKVTAELADTMQMKLSTLVGNFPLDIENQTITAKDFHIENHYFEQELTYYQNYDWLLLRDLTRIQLHLLLCLKTERPLGKNAETLLESYLKTHLEGCKKWGLIRSSIEVLITLASIYSLKNDKKSSIIYLERALIMAAPENFVRAFLDQLPLLDRLLRKIKAQGGFVDFIGKIFDESKRVTAYLPMSSDNAELNAGQLTEELSARELEVLKLIAKGHSNQDISSELFISLNTVKSHVSHIFEKLGVNKRTKAIPAAKKLGIL